MAVTLKDIAKKAGVSVSTVSRIINNDTSKKASQETTDKVWSIVKELGYTPNQSARNLIKQSDEQQEVSTRAIGCIFTSAVGSCTDPFFSQMAIGIQKEIHKRGYVMGYSFSSYDMTNSAMYNNLSANKVDGAIILGQFNKDTLKILKANIKNLIYAGVNAVNAGFDEVICDGYRGASAAAQYLIDLGHKDIGFIGPIKGSKENEVINEHRFEGYRSILEQHGFAPKQDYIFQAELSTLAGYEAAKRMLQIKQLPTAVFCANDMVAIGVIRAINESGLKIPEDISVIGLDDIEMASYTTPPLTTIKIPKQELGKLAVKILIDRIEEEHVLPMRVDLPFELVVRESCKSI